MPTRLSDRTIRRNSRKGLALAADPFARTKLDYAYNLVVAGLLSPKTCRLDAIALVQRLFGSRRMVRKRVGSRVVRVRDTLSTRGRLRAAVAAARGELRTPAPAAAPVCDNLQLLARTAELNEVELRVLEFAIACTDCEMVDLLEPIRCESRRMMNAVIAAAIARPAAAVDEALGLRGRLLTTGLITLDPHGDVDDRLKVDARLLDAVGVAGLTAQGLMDRYLPATRPPTLVLEDYAHLRGEVELARRVLTAAIAERRSGVNLLLHGPTGTGKSELARLLGSLAGVPLYQAGREGDGGKSPDAAARLRSLMLGNRMLGDGRALLLFDEMEDLFESNVLARLAGDDQDGALMSKQWFNALLESNPVPTIWISNSVRGVDAAFLRRFTYVIEVGAFTAAQRRRAWLRHLGGDGVLPANDVEHLAARFEVSPAHIGTAVATARLASGGRLDRRLLEAVLEPAEKLLRGARTRLTPFDPGRYRPDVVNTWPVDLEEVAARLAAWRPGDGAGISLCLYGPPGTGKSAYVRYLAHRMDRPLVARRVSDLMSCWVGETEQNIAEAFAEARGEGAVLLLDEADSFLQDRRHAAHSWEVTMTNELLQQMEAFPGVLACTTNLFRTLDQASLRRFTFKIAFTFLRADQALRLFRLTLEDLGGAAGEEEAVAAGLARVTNLAPGDFAAVTRRLKALGETPSARRLLDELRAEAQVKEGTPRRVGF